MEGKAAVALNAVKEKALDMHQELGRLMGGLERYANWYTSHPSPASDRLRGWRFSHGRRGQ